MFLRKMKTATVLLFLATGIGVSVLGREGLAQRPPVADAELAKRQQPRLDLHGDPLPDGALARLGTIRLRHGHGISGAAFSSDGKKIFAADYYSGVHVWDVAEGKEVRRFFADDLYCHRLALSPDGRTLAVALGDLTVRLCDPHTGQELGALPKDKDRLNQLVFSPDGTLLATATGRESVHVWDVASQKLLQEVTFSENVGSVAFSSDGRLLACSTGDGRCHLWDFALGKEVRQLSNEEGKHYLFAAFAHHGGPLAVWGYLDASIRLFDANGVKELRRFNKAGAARKFWTDGIYASFSPNGKILACLRDVGQLELWDVESARQLRTLTCDRSHIPSFLSFSPDGTKLMSAGDDFRGGDNAVRVWDVAQGKELLPRAGHGSPVSSVALSPDGTTVATTGNDGVVYLWDRSSGKQLFRLEGHPGRQPRVSFSSEGRRVIWRGDYDGDGTLRSWDAQTGQSLSQLKLPYSEASWTAVADDGKLAVSIDRKENRLRFHDLATGQVIRELPDAYHRPVVLAPAGDKMVCIDGTVISLIERKELFNVGRLYSPNPSVRFSADGRKLIAAVVHQAPGKELLVDPNAEEIAVFDAIQSKELRRFGRKEGKFLALDAATLSRDGKTTITAGASGDKPDEQIITLWETETGKERGHFLGHIGQVQSVAISADGRFVVSGAADTTALVWDAARPRTRNAAALPKTATTEWAAHFKNLAGDDAELAYASLWAFRNASQQTVAFLGEQRSLFARTEVRVLQRWIQDLDSNEFAERERASRELGLILDEAEAPLKKALQNEPSLEARRRIEQLLEERSLGASGRELQRLRVLEILEHLAAPGTDDAPGADATRLAAIALLKKFAAGAPEARLAQEAKASLERLK